MSSDEHNIKNKTIVIWFSCGAASAVAAKKTIELYGDHNKIIVINNPVKEEDSDNRRFLKDVEKWLGTEIQIATNRKYPDCSIVDVFNDRKYMGGIAGAPCTGELKKKARQQWENENNYDYIVLGFTLEEKKRHDRFVLSERSEVLPVLINENITKQDCFRIINEAKIDLPRIYKLGYPNANCIGCVKATSPTYWNHVRDKHPKIFSARAEQSERIGAKLVRYKGDRILLKDLPIDAKGKPLKKMDIDCGIFCEEKQ